LWPDQWEQQMETSITYIPLEKIIIPAGRRESDNVDDLMDSISTLGLINIPTVIPQPLGYLVVAGVRRCIAYERLGERTIPAIVREMDELHAELATIDENLIRRELTALEHAEQLARKKEIYEALHPETKQGHGPGRGHHEKKRKEFGSFADDTTSKLGCTPRTIQQAVQIARSLSDRTKEIIRPPPIADNKGELVRLMQLPPERQEAIAALLASGGATSLRAAKQALNADAAAPDSTPATRRGPQRQPLDPRPTRVQLDGGDQDTPLHTVVERLK
jgi:ParB family transcriptional regulator, chromosome partitioning protein